uniref:Uncharacterized protein n=1 Tax=Anguilla anguilla TaxID=7936 RepID=A0A0E9W0U2_ANGAN
MIQYLKMDLKSQDTCF